MSRKKKKTIPDGGVLPFCPHFELCGGCTYQRFDYEGQKRVKLSAVQEMMREVFPDFPLEEALGSPMEKEYRNKMEFSFGDQEKNGPLTLGLHQRGSFYNVVPILDCEIIDSDYRAILWMTLQFFSELGLPYVHKQTHEGVLRHLLIRKSHATGEILVAIVTSSQGFIFDDANEIEEPQWMNEYRDRLLLLDLTGEISGILHIINDSPADVIRADHIVLLHGRGWFEERILGLSFKITPFSFFQTNSTGAEVLYSVVREYISDIEKKSKKEGNTIKTLYDLYSGTGTIAQILAPVADRVIGVEIVEEAVEAARENALQNGLSNVEFIAGDVMEVLDGIDTPPEVMVLDPPREGIHPKVLPRLLAYGVRYFVYVSCKPESLARDTAVILEAGYQPIRAVCVDMFPWTKHIETVVLYIHGGPPA